MLSSSSLTSSWKTPWTVLFVINIVCRAILTLMLPFSFTTSSHRIRRKRPRSSPRNSINLSMLVLFPCSLIIVLLLRESTCVTVHEVRLLSDSGKSDFALVGEGVTFSCLFILDPGEEIHSVIWEKDKEQVYTYHKDTLEPPTPLGILKGHVDATNESPSTLIVKNVTIDMHGSYSCQVITKKGRSQNEAFLIVILDACKETSFETNTDMVSCVEDVTFYCRGMFPKPAPVCGIYNDVTGSYVQSVPFDRVERMEDGTYEISLFRRLHAKDWLKFPGQLSFRCFMIVMSTTWRRGIHHRLFGDAGCVTSPPIVKNGYFNMTSESTCWQTPREGSRLSYSCLTGFELLGPEQLICRNGSWKATPSPRKIMESSSPTHSYNGQNSNNLNSNKIYTRRIIPKGPQITVCNSASSRTSSPFRQLLQISPSLPSTTSVIPLLLFLLSTTSLSFSVLR